MGKRPDYSGQITTFEDNRIGSIALWENNNDDEKQPEYTGTVSFYNGEKSFKVALWERSDEDRERRNRGSKG